MTRRFHRRAAALLLGAAALAASPPSGPAASAPAPASVPPIESIDAAGLLARVEALKGQVVLVNLWATWCEPCREEFPVFVTLDAELRSRGLAVLSVSLDASSSLDTAVRPFLASQKVSFPCFIKAPGDDDAFINAIDPAWSGALPATFVYDPAGRRIHSLFGQVTLEPLRDTLTRALPPR
jgi:thiol-disulfide isomerase/thioredoxin